MSDWIPVVSQVKSSFQLACGDVEGAVKTQQNFVRQCPVFSQVTSTIQYARGDLAAARETERQHSDTMSNVADGIPVVGHVKGAVHYATGDKERGNRAIISATRTTVVLGAGAVGCVAGPAGACAGGIAAGVAFDSVHSISTNQPQGSIAAFDTAFNNPSPGATFEAVMGPVSDGMTGMAGGNLAKSIKANKLLRKADKYESRATKIMQAADENRGSMNSAGYMAEADKAQKLASKANEFRAKAEGQAPASTYDNRPGGNNGGEPYRRGRLLGGAKDAGKKGQQSAGKGGSKGGNPPTVVIPGGGSERSPSASSRSQTPKRPQRDQSNNDAKKPNWPRAQSLREANQMVVKALIECIEGFERYQIPNNALQWILKILRDPNRPMNQFYLTNVSHNVVQIDYTFSGESRDGETWHLEVSINADVPNDKHKHPHHYGGDISLKGMDKVKKRFVVHVEVPEEKFKAGRLDDKSGPSLEKFDSGKKKENDLNNGGKAKWKWQSEKLPEEEEDSCSTNSSDSDTNSSSTTSNDSD